MLLITTSCNKQMARYHLTPDQGNSISLVKSVAESRNERGLVFLIYALEPYFQHPDILSIDPDNMRKEDSSEGSTIRLALEAISGHDSVNERDLSGYSPLYRSILHGNHFLVKKLLDHFPKNINKDMRFGVDGWTALHLAAALGHLPIVKELVSHGFDVGATCNTHLYTPLHLAAKKGHTEVVKMLVGVEGVDVNENSNHSGSAPLHIALENGHTEVIKALLQAPGIQVNKVDRCGDVPLGLAAKHGHTEIVSILVGMKGVDVNAIPGATSVPVSYHINLMSGYINNPLHIAAHYGRTEVVNILVGVKEVDVNKKNLLELAPLHIAAKHGHAEIVSILVGVEEVDVNKKITILDVPLFI